MFFKGVTFGFFARNGFYSSPEARQEVDKMVELGIPWVCIVVSVVQEKYSSTRQYRDFQYTPGDDEIIDIVNYCHEKGMKVMLRPMIDGLDGSQRGDINFPQDREVYPGRKRTYWKDWFDSYINLTKHYTRIASKLNCESYGLDSELAHTVNQNDNWLRVIEAARQNYKGHLTSSVSWAHIYLDDVRNNPNHWFYALDSLGSSMYLKAADKANSTIEEMIEFMKPELNKIKEFIEVYNKTYYLGECGCASVFGGATKPSDWTLPGGYNGEESANYLSAVIKLYNDEPWWGGLFWWKWDEHNDRPFLVDKGGNKGFTLYGKPAAEVMKQWCNS